MNIIEVIIKKRDKKDLTKEEINFVIDGFVKKEIKDYQMSSLLMAICLNGMNEEEIINLTEAMINSGDIVDLSRIDGVVVDKHSTGGVGDKISLTALPIAAAAGVKVAKMSGRGLGHTGGTVDKLEAIPGFKVNLSEEEFIKQVNDINISTIGKMSNIAQADKLMYALRDVTGTVMSIPLIASSIMSKKIALNANAIVLDVKYGDGAFMKTKEMAAELAETMVMLGKAFNKKTVALITNMNEPLGYNVGNSLEVIEAVEVLDGKGEEDLTNLSLEIASQMISLGLNLTIEEARIKAKELLESKAAVMKLSEYISTQGGDLTKLEISKRVFDIKSTKEGYVQSIDCDGVGNLARRLGAGRLTKEDVIDPTVGIKLFKKIGDKVLNGETLMRVFFNKEGDIKISEFQNAFLISEEDIIKDNLVDRIIR